jgi:hypothetical protein
MPTFIQMGLYMKKYMFAVRYSCTRGGFDKAMPAM